MRVGVNKPDCLLIACPSDHPFPNLPTGLICAATFISLPSSQNCMGCGVRGLSVRNKTRKTLAERGSERILCKYVCIFMFPPPPLPAAHQNELRLSAGVWTVGQGRARWTPAASDSHISVLPPIQGCRVMATLTPTCPYLGGFSPPPPRMG